MAHTTNVRRFRTNPVEIAVFTVVTMICVKSVYSLFYDHQTFHPATLTSMSASPVTETVSRNPASVTTSTFLNHEVRCGMSDTVETTASKVKLTGMLCGIEAAAGRSPAGRNPLLKTTVINDANKFTATVFPDTHAGKYSTDYMPLNTGRNPIRVEFTYQDGKIITQELTISKN